MNKVLNFELNAVRLQEAVLCAGCEVISDSPHDACLVCGSRSLLPLARVLGTAPAWGAGAVPHEREERPAGMPQVVVLLPSIPHRTRPCGPRRP